MTTFTDEQLDALRSPLDKSVVKTRQQAGRDLSYIEGWHVIAEANRIFGFDAWSRELLSLECVGSNKTAKEKDEVHYIARVRVRVGDIVREGAGYGNGFGGSLGEAHELAVKEAETDAMKRALATFGDPFGLALYDKTQSRVVDGKATQHRDDMTRTINDCKTVADLDALANSDEFRKALRELPQNYQREVRRVGELKRSAINNGMDGTITIVSEAAE